jgi:NCS1 family nucleobase:cation symporter-1
MHNMLRAIFGHNFTDIPNALPASAGITTSLMLAFFLSWLVHLPFCYFRPYQLRKFFWFKTIVSLPSMFGLFIWAMVNTNGKIGSLYSVSSRSSSATAWLILAGINSGMGYGFHYFP